MTFTIYGDTDFSACSAAAQEDARVVRQIEDRARELHNQLSRLETRWYRRMTMLETHSGGKLGYEFRDNFA